MIKKALIFAAGKGTRLKPFTDSHPKALMPVNGIPLLERNILYLKQFGVQEFVINIHHFGEQILDFLSQKNDFGVKIDISDERLSLLETGGGLLFAKNLLEQEDDFIIMNADILTDLNITEMMKAHFENKNLVTLAVSDRESSRKLLFDKEMRLCGWKNTSTGETRLAEQKEDLKEFAFSGIHCVNSKLFGLIQRTGKFSIIDEYLDLMQKHAIFGFQHHARFIDVGRPESVTEAEKYF